LGVSAGRCPSCTAGAGSWEAALVAGFLMAGGTPDSWMVYFMENHPKNWMMRTGGYPHCEKLPYKLIMVH